MKTKYTQVTLIASLLLFCILPVFAKEQPARESTAGLVIREINYSGTLTDAEAKFVVDLEAEAIGKGECRITLFEGDIALLPPEKLSSRLQIVREGNRYILVAEHDGEYRCRLELVAKIHRKEPWNSISFTGPTAAISSVRAEATGSAMEVQLLSGTLLESKSANGVSSVKGFLGPDRQVTLRWQGNVAEVVRKALLTVETTVASQITPTVIKYTTHLKYDIVQGNAPTLTLSIPGNQTLTRLTGAQIRDWQINAGQASSPLPRNSQILTVEFIKPIEKEYELTLFTEQTVESTPRTVPIDPPQPMEVERETGVVTLSSEDTVVEINSIEGLRQVNAGESAMAAYRFIGRPFELTLNVSRIEPVIHSVDRVHARLEETRLLVTHTISLNVEEAGIYELQLQPQTDFVVADVQGDGIEEWRVVDGALRVNFSTRVLGWKRFEVRLEQALRDFPEAILTAPLRVMGAEQEDAQIGVAAAPGIRVKTAELIGLREVPVRELRGAGFPRGSIPEQAIQRPAERPVSHSDELLAYTADQPDWQLRLASERLSARIVADVFNLITIGDGIVGGSATIRFGLVNQGVQEFQVQLPPHCRNVEFTGPNIRRKELTNNVWTIGLQDKAWGGYTLVVTYDFQFDPNGATLPLGGIHPLDVERETGSVAVTTAASLLLNASGSGEFIRRVDESELSASDRALITRAVVLAWQYSGSDYQLALEAKRFAELPVLEAVADRTQLTSVLTETGEMLTQASFMVKNNEKQFQRFELPAGADLWACYVNGQATKPEQDDGWVLVPLPRNANRDQTFAVDIVYAQNQAALASRWSQPLVLAAPKTDVPNTYAEWELYVPESHRMSSFGGSMNVAQGTTYGVFDAWQKFLAFYLVVLREIGPAIFGIGGLVLLVVVLTASAARRGWGGVITTLGVLCILAVLAAMMLPALSKAKAKAQRISSVNNLKQVGLAARQFAMDNDDRLPVSFEEMMNELNTDKVTVDPSTGTRYVYLGGGMKFDELRPDSVLAYSPIVDGGCNVLFADGSVSQVSAAKFGELSQRGLVVFASEQQVAQQRQTAAVMGAQFQSPVAQQAADPARLPAAAATTPTLGPRSIRIELPRTGKPFVFTKVLNVHDEPLSVSAKIMPLSTFQWMQMTAQLVTFVAGLILGWLVWRRRRRSSFLLTVALALMLGSVTSLLVAWRALHDLLIIGFPVAMLALIAYLVWRFWPRRHAEPEEEVSAMPSPQSGLPPVTAAIALLVTLGLSTASATESEISNLRSQIASPPESVSILSAEYSGTVNDRVAQLQVTLQLSADAANRLIELFGGEVAVQEFRSRRGDAELVREGNSIAVQLGRRKEATVELQLLVKVGGDITRRHLVFTVPSALSSRVLLTLDQPDADIDFPTAISFQRIADQDRTRVEAVMGAASQIELHWTPRVKRAAEVAATVFCRNGALASFGGGVMNVRSVLDYQVTQGELRQLRVRIPDGQRLLRVEGDSIRTWETKIDEGQTLLLVELLRGISPDYSLTVETEQPLEIMPASVKVQLPHALDVKRETGLVALRASEELGLSVEIARDVQRVDAGEFNRIAAHETRDLSSVFSFLRPDFDLAARVELVQPQIEAVARNSVRVGDEQVRLTSVIDYTIKRSGVFSVKLALPADYRLEQVLGEKMLQWVERIDGEARLLEVTLQERISGDWRLRVELSRSHRTLPPSLNIPGVQPLGTEKLVSYLAVGAEPGVGVKTASSYALTEIPPSESGIDLNRGSAAAGTLAFKHIATNPAAALEWKLTVATETVQAWVRAEVVNTITIGETLINGRAVVRYDIANAPVKQLRLRIPEAFQNVEISGANIRQRDRDGDVWRIELQSKVQGVRMLTVSWEQPRPNSTNALDLAGVGAPDVERETGQLIIVARPPLQVAEEATQDLQKIDTRDVPDWAGQPDDAAVLAYRYVRPVYRLAVQAQRFQEAAVLQALVDTVRLTSVVAEDGQMMTQMTLAVRNNGRQFLEIELPAGSRVWSAFVAGQSVRPSLRENRILLPLEQTGAEDAAATIELTYAGTNTFPRKHGRLAFESPKLDAPLKNAQWELYLPPNYHYDGFAGTMNREVTAAPSLLSSFTMSDYWKKEKAGKAAAEAEAKEYVSKAQRKLSSGNVRDAVNDLNRARYNYSADTADEDVKALEQQVRQAQASNLINAQNDFVFSSNGRMTAQPAANAVQYDNSAAEQQWAKLQQAQEVVTSHLQPLHVNLPVRGLRYAFTQVLQTQTNKSLTVELSARNQKTGNLTRKAGISLAGFLGLWGIVALVTGRKRE